MKDSLRIEVFILTLALLAAPASITVHAQPHDAIFLNIKVSSKIYYSDILSMSVTVRNDRAGVSSADLFYKVFLDDEYWHSSPTQNIPRSGGTYTWNDYQTGLSLGNHTLRFHLYWNNAGSLNIEDISETYNVSVVNLSVSNWQPQPLSVQRGKGTPFTLSISFTNGGNDIMASPSVSVNNSMGLTITPTLKTRTDLPAGDTWSFGFSVSAPSSLSSGSYNVSFTVTYNDFLGRSHSENETAQIDVASLATNLTLTTPASAHQGDPITISAKLLDENGKAVPGQTISFTIEDQDIGSSSTDLSGKASTIYNVSLPLGNYTIIASYAGSADYGSSSTSGTLLINPLYLTVTTSIPSAQIVTVNGTLYTTDATGKALIPIGQKGTYNVGIVSPCFTSPSTKAIFLSWADSMTSNPRIVIIDADQTLSAITKTQNLLTLDAPPGSSPSGAQWYDSSSAANATIRYSWASDTDTRSNLIAYSLDGGSNTSVPRSGSGIFSVTTNMSYPHVITFYGTTQYNLNVSGGNNLTFGTTSPTNDGWYDQATSTTVSSDYVWGPTNLTRQRLLRWSLDTSAATTVPVRDSGRFTTPPIQMNARHTVSFSSIDQFYVNITSPFGTPSGSGWFDKGSSASFSVTPTTTSAGLLTYNVFSGWSGDSTDKNSSATITIDAPKTIIAKWTVDSTQLYLTAAGVAAVIIIAGAMVWRRSKK